MYRTCVVNDAGLVKTVETLRVAKPTSTTDVWQKKWWKSVFHSWHDFKEILWHKTFFQYKNLVYCKANLYIYWIWWNHTSSSCFREIQMTLIKNFLLYRKYRDMSCSTALQWSTHIHSWCCSSVFLICWPRDPLKQHNEGSLCLDTTGSKT